MIEWLIQKRLFRNANHAIWFTTSFGFFLMVFAYYFWPDRLGLVFLVPLVIHLPPFLASLVKALRKETNEIYSKDCIWFNALMILIYFMMAFWLTIGER